MGDVIEKVLLVASVLALLTGGVVYKALGSYRYRLPLAILIGLLSCLFFAGIIFATLGSL